MCHLGKDIMKCKKCGFHNTDGSLFCNHCGGRLATDEKNNNEGDFVTVSCPSCSSENKNGSLFCNECGEKLLEADVKQDFKVASKESSVNSLKNRKIMFFAVTISILLICALFIGMYIQDKNSKTAFSNVFVTDDIKMFTLTYRLHGKTELDDTTKAQIVYFTQRKYDEIKPTYSNVGVFIYTDTKVYLCTYDKSYRELGIKCKIKEASANVVPVNEIDKQIKESISKKDGKWEKVETDSNGVPLDILKK